MKRIVMTVLAVVAVRSAVYGGTFKVTNVSNSGDGSFRWAIEQANATPGADTIVMAPIGTPTVFLLSPLPPITEAVSISSGFTIDGSYAGTSDGIVVNADRVYIEFLKVLNFSGDGFVIRGNDDTLYWGLSSGNRNGVRVEGDKADIRGGQFVHNAENGVWVMSTSSGNQIGIRVPDCHILCPPQAGMNDMSGNGKNGLRLDGSGTVVDWAFIGTNGSNGGDGLVINGAHNTVINSNLSNNHGHGAFLGLPAHFENVSGGCNTGTFIAGAVFEPPALLFARSDPTVLTVRGELRAKPGAHYTIDVHNATQSCPAGNTSIGSVVVTTDGTGFSAWEAALEHAPVTGVSAIATGMEYAEETSRRSDLLATFVSGDPRVDLDVRTLAPRTALTSERIDFKTVVTNNGPSAVNRFAVELSRPEGATVDSVSTSSGTCYPGFTPPLCEIGPLAPGAQVTIDEWVKVVAQSGTLRHVATARLATGTFLTDVNAANNTAAVSVEIVKATRHRPSRP